MWNANNSYVIFPFVSLRTYSENDCTTVVPPELCLSPTKDLVYSKTAKQCLEEISGTVGRVLLHVHMHTYTQSDIRERRKPDTHTHTHRQRSWSTHTDSLCRPPVPCCCRSKKRSDMTGGQRPALFGRPGCRMCCLFVHVCISLCGTVMWQLIAEDRCLGLSRCSHTSLNNQSASNCKK